MQLCYTVASQFIDIITKHCYKTITEDIVAQHNCHNLHTMLCNNTITFEVTLLHNNDMHNKFVTQHSDTPNFCYLQIDLALR